MTSLTSRCLPPILAEIPFPAAHRPDLDWQEAAVCRQEDPELFFPIGTTGAAVAEIQRAKAVCARCRPSLPITACSHTPVQRSLHYGNLTETVIGHHKTDMGDGQPVLRCKAPRPR